MKCLKDLRCTVYKESRSVFVQYCISYGDSYGDGEYGKNKEIAPLSGFSVEVKMYL